MFNHTSTPNLTPLLKPASLSHSTTSPTSIVPPQTVNAALSSFPAAGGTFIIFVRGIQPSPEPEQPSWDTISGHAFTLLPSGHLIYGGCERGIESVFTRQWPALKKLTPTSTGDNRVALLASGNCTSFVVADLKVQKGRGSWKKLVGEEEGEGDATHCVFMELPLVVGMLIARGVEPAAVSNHLQRGPHGTVKVGGEVGEWKEPEGDEELVGDAEWKRGWWVTERVGMGVWVS